MDTGEIGKDDAASNNSVRRIARRAKRFKKYAQRLKKGISRRISRISKKNLLFRKIVNFSKRNLSSLRYFLRFFLPHRVEDNIIIFESFWGRNYSCSPKALYEKMVKDPKYADFTFVWAFRKLKKGSAEVMKETPNEQTVFVKYASSDYYKYHSRAKYSIRNARLPEGIIKKRNQVHIQTWHGTPLKRLGHDLDVEGASTVHTVKELQNKYDRDTKTYDFMLSPSRFSTEKFMSGFNLKALGKERIIIEEGYPRNDFLHNADENDIARLKDEMGIPKDKRVILYAPTWRDASHVAGKGYTYDLNINFDNLYNKLKDEYVVLFRTHYLISNTFKFEDYEGFIFNFSKYDDINHLYVVSDLLITDYSSVFFDYANLRRPILFYMYDLEHYQNKARGFYIDLTELPGPIAHTEKELLSDILNIDTIQTEYAQKYQSFSDTYTYLDDGQASKRVLKRIGL
ncbi:MAG: CDP-glycerol glycerophosphotransferase family protein [Coriobacteriia bacterium]|nr:CDP-glycerol glycerophosphotransferase family protein [Coriobacteriia bacterium]